MRKAPLLLSLLWLVGTVQARGGMPTPTTERGRIIEDIYFQIFVAGVVVFLIVFGLLVFVLWRYRENSGHGRATYEHERENLKAELTWTVIPLIIVLWVGVISYGGLIQLDEEALDRDFAAYAALRAEGFPAEKGMTIDLTASQYNWHADYGGGVSVFANPDGNTGAVSDANRFHVPAGVPIKFQVTSQDVIHSFYVQDSNLGPVGMVDANPNGPHKINTLVVTFSEGEYRVQCKEMCMNPGHAYMRARIVAEPESAFDAWYEEKALEARCGDAVLAKAGFTITDAGVASEDAENGTITTVAGTCLIASLDNQRSESVTVALTGGPSFTVAAGASDRVLLNFTDAGIFSLGMGTGDVVAFEVIQAEVVQVTLYEYAIAPARIELEAGKTYLFQVRNTGSQPHNIFIGMVDDAGSEVEWASATIGGGGSTSLIVRPTASLTLDTWCDVPGHRGLGMQGALVIQ